MTALKTKKWNLAFKLSNSAADGSDRQFYNGLICKSDLYRRVQNRHFHDQQIGLLTFWFRDEFWFGSIGLYLQKLRTLVRAAQTEHGTAFENGKGKRSGRHRVTCAVVPTIIQPAGTCHAGISTTRTQNPEPPNKRHMYIYVCKVQLNPISK